MADRKYYVLCEANCKFEGLSKEQTLAAIEQAINDGKITNVDTGFVTKLKEHNKNAALSYWVGTQAEYNALTEYIENCFYIITDDSTYDDLLAAFAEVEKETENNGEMVAKANKNVLSVEAQLNNIAKKLDTIYAINEGVTFITKEEFVKGGFGLEGNAVKWGEITEIWGNTSVVNGTLVDEKISSIATTDFEGNILGEYIVPQGIRQLDGYGKSIVGGANYVDFKTKKFNKVVSTVDLGSLEGWQIYDLAMFGVEFNVGYADLLGTLPAILCGKYTPATAYDVKDRQVDKTIAYVKEGEKSMIYICDSTYADNLTAFKNSLAGVLMNYALKETEKIDIGYLCTTDNFVELNTSGNSNGKVVTEGGNVSSVASAKIKWQARI